MLFLIVDLGPEVLKVIPKEFFPVGADEVTPQVVVKVDGHEPHH